MAELMSPFAMVVTTAASPTGRRLAALVRAALKPDRANVSYWNTTAFAAMTSQSCRRFWSLSF